MKHSAPSLNQAVKALATACLISVGNQAFAVFYKGDFQIVVGLNPSANLFAKIAKSALAAEEISGRYAVELGIPPEVAADFVELIAEDWRRIGAIGPDPWLTSPPKCEAADAPTPETADFDAPVNIGGETIRVILHGRDLAALTMPMIEGLSDDGTAPEFSIRAWWADGTGHVLTSSGQFEALGSAETTRDRILTILMQNSWPDLVDAPCIHGATLRSPAGRHVMLSGDSGRGKTTLALGLAKQRFTLLSDDMSVFSTESRTIAPMKFNPSVKQGAWGPLAEDYPELASQTPIEVKGRLCKYIRRPKPHEREEFHSVDALVFPRWDPGAEAKLTPYDGQEALLSMLRCSYLPNNQTGLQAMADFLSALPTYELSYSTFKEADELLMDVLECPK